jgi:hypothetical protein
LITQVLDGGVLTTRERMHGRGHEHERLHGDDLDAQVVRTLRLGEPDDRGVEVAAGPLRIYERGWGEPILFPYSPTPDEYRAGLEQVRAAAAAAGRARSSITPGLYVTVAVGEGNEPHERLDS